MFVIFGLVMNQIQMQNRKNKCQLSVEIYSSVTEEDSCYLHLKFNLFCKYTGVNCEKEMSI